MWHLPLQSARPGVNKELGVQETVLFGWGRSRWSPPARWGIAAMCRAGFGSHHPLHGLEERFPKPTCVRCCGCLPSSGLRWAPQVGEGPPTATCGAGASLHAVVTAPQPKIPAE